MSETKFHTHTEPPAKMDICEKVEVEKRNKYPKHEHKELKSEN
jgi:hypothetical protein